MLPAWLAAGLWTGASVAALAGVVVVVRRALGRPAPGWLVAVVTCGAFALEPVSQNLTFGQVNLVLMLAVLVDLVRPERRWSGVLVGIAAGVKLTPLVFVVLLVLVGRRGAAARAAAAFAATVAVGFAAAPGSSTTYWTDRLVDAGRVGPPALAHNQSVYGALTRLLDGPPPTLLWLAIAGPLAAAVLLVGAAWWRRGERVLGTCLAAMAMLARLAGLVVAPLGVGGPGRPGAVGAEPVGERRVDRGVRGPPDPVAALGPGSRVRLEPDRARRRQRLPPRRAGVLRLGSAGARAVPTARRSAQSSPPMSNS